jgi:hypothetical protein
VIITDRYFVKRYLSHWSFARQGVVMLMICIFLSLAVATLHPNFYPHRFLTVLVENYRLFSSSANRIADFQYGSLSPTWASILENAPLALFNVLFRPFPWDAQSVLPALASVENAVLLVLFVFSLRNISIIPGSPQRWVTVSTIAYILILAVFLGLSTPNFGTLSRYRIGFLPFFVLLLCYRNPLMLWLLKRFRPK